MSSITLALAGVGNCASALMQGISSYADAEEGRDTVRGLMHVEMGGYHVSDIQPVAAFDIDERKVGAALEDAIFASPNCTTVFQDDIPETGVTVQMGPIHDGVADHLSDHPAARRVVPADRPASDVIEVLETADVDVLVNFLPVGSQRATEH